MDDFKDDSELIIQVKEIVIYTIWVFFVGDYYIKVHNDCRSAYFKVISYRF